MKIGIIGATGKAGKLIAAEAYRRGHDITAIVIDPENVDNKNYTVVEKNVFDLAVDDLKDFDAVINCFGVFNPGLLIQHQTSLATLINIMEQLPDIRFLMVGGAASLYTDETKTKKVIETIPEAWAGVPKNMAKAFEALKASSVNWTYFSPAGTFDPAGPATGDYIIGDNDVAILNEDGESYISYADYAVAMIDELEQKRFVRRRLTAVTRTKNVAPAEESTGMKVGIIGATGKAGRLIAKEAYDRGHKITAIVIDPENVDNKDYTILHKSIFDLTVDDLKDFDVVINCFGTFNPGLLIQHETTLATLINIMEQLPEVRFMMVGGAASLYTDETKTERILDTMLAAGRSEDSVPGHMAKGLNKLKLSKVNWTYFSPAATFDREGPRTGEYILNDDDVAMPNEDGESYISYADYAIAMVDEMEAKRYSHRRITAVTRTKNPAEKTEEPKTADPINPDGDDMGAVIATYRGPLCYELAGKSFDLCMDDAGDYLVEFGSNGTLTWAKAGEPARWERYECLKGDNTTYFVNFEIAGAEPRTGVVLVLDTAQSLVTTVICRQSKGADGKLSPISGDYYFGAIRVAGEDLPTERHFYTDDLVGKTVRWDYSPDFYVTHVYHSPYYMSTGLASYKGRKIEKNIVNDPCKYIKIKEDLYLVSFFELENYRKHGAGSNLTILANTKKMIDVGRSFDYNHKGEKENYLYAAVGKWLD